MPTQLHNLLLLQELDSLLQDLEAGGRAAEETLGFSIAPLEATQARRAEVASSVDADVLRRYEQVRRRHARALAPVHDGVCLGCFTKRPTRTAIKPTGIEACERCGRILYPLDQAE